VYMTADVKYAAPHADVVSQRTMGIDGHAEYQSPNR
jgi:hypothetical protein